MNERLSPFTNIPPVVKNLLIINVIFYIATMMFGGPMMTKVLGVHYFDSPDFRIWQVITYMFMHDYSSLFHILFNMFALYTFGSSIEHIMGSKRFLNFYLITGLGALALQLLVQSFEVYSITGSAVNNGSFMVDSLKRTISFNPDLISKDQASTLLGIYLTPMVGASGAIFGVLIAFGMLFPNAELFIMFIPVPVKAKYIIPVYVLLELFLGVKQFSGDSVAHFAHLGGALFGFILVKMWHLKRHDNFL
ncbi:MAG: rhomboid family intramembrane serine protease [Daejeonella sp.]|uniref:rhomboid family intramembrane serine protease n=1 Tax=Daejeonella sp. TaxID=2805397 RepID=UPI002733563E|nr:rhomboid family intramembrane serine protease [Daejeonella sp.]MDP3467283.1 rhomboid family intramembrane serine protease [Daejeonella sp.]